MLIQLQDLATDPVSYGSFLPPPQNLGKSFGQFLNCPYCFCVQVITRLPLSGIDSFGHCTSSSVIKSNQCLYLNIKLVVSTWLGQELHKDRSSKIKHRWIKAYGWKRTMRNSYWICLARCIIDLFLNVKAFCDRHTIQLKQHHERSRWRGGKGHISRQTH